MKCARISVLSTHVMPSTRRVVVAMCALFGVAMLATTPPSFEGMFMCDGAMEGRL